MPDTDLLETKINWVESSEEATQESRTSSERDRDYYDNKQWSDDEVTVLKRRGQAPIVDNRIKRKVDFLKGVERRLRTDPKAFPRTPVHEDDAESATDAIRFVCDNNDWDTVRSRVWDNLLIEGMGGCDATVEIVNDKPEIVLTYIPWDRIGYDPHSREPDFSDAKYKFIIIWMDREDAIADYGEEKGGAIDDSFVGSSAGETFDDTPKFSVWADAKRKRVRVVQMHYLKDEEWWICTFVKGGFLEDPQASPYLDEFGVPVSSFSLTSSYMDRDNNRYGYVRSMIWPQDEINKRKSKALHLLNTRRVISSGDVHLGDGETTDPSVIREEIARPDSYVVVPAGGRFEVESNTEMAAGQLGLLQEAKESIDQMGPNQSQTGDVTGESGRAIQAKQQGGLIEMEPLTDSHKKWSRTIYRSVWNLIRQFWTEERWVRVTDDQSNMKWVAINQTLRSQLQQMPPEEQAAAARELQLVPGDPRLDQVVANQLSELDVDISLDDGPDIVTLQDEQFQQLMGMFEKGIFTPDERDLLIEASSLRNKDAILERIRGNEQDKEEQAAQAQAEAQKQAEIEQITKAGAIAEIEQTEADTAKKQSETAENIADTRLKAAQAEEKMRLLQMPMI